DCLVLDKYLLAIAGWANYDIPDSYIPRFCDHLRLYVHLPRSSRAINADTRRIRLDSAIFG
ncbi:MAG: hypothetical protein E7G41_01015, partial [Bifidobacterium sp.]|nr:hypothetical protein [Bifidobacterium sp.]